MRTGELLSELEAATGLIVRQTQSPDELFPDVSTKSQAMRSCLTTFTTVSRAAS